MIIASKKARAGPWEAGKLGNDARYARRVSATEEARIEAALAKPKRSLGLEVLQGLRELKRGRTGRITKIPMHNPPHPGEIIRSLCLEPLGLTVTAAAKGLGVDRKALLAILDGRMALSAEMAVRLSIAFNTPAETWLNAQLRHDLWHAETRRKKLRVTKLGA